MVKLKSFDDFLKTIPDEERRSAIEQANLIFESGAFITVSASEMRNAAYLHFLLEQYHNWLSEQLNN